MNLINHHKLFYSALVHVSLDWTHVHVAIPSRGVIWVGIIFLTTPPIPQVNSVYTGNGQFFQIYSAITFMELLKIWYSNLHLGGSSSNSTLWLATRPTHLLCCCLHVGRSYVPYYLVVVTIFKKFRGTVLRE